MRVRSSPLGLVVRLKLCYSLYMAYTGEQKREYQVAWLAKRRQDWIDSQGGACRNCGSSDQLEIDHINPEEKEYSPTALWSRNKSIRDRELAKCQILCHDCHKKKTRTQLFKEGHGNRARYKNGCRCVICKAGEAQRMREYRKRKKELDKQ